MSGLNTGSPKTGKKFKFGIQWKITLIIVAVVAVFTAFILGYILPQMENSLYTGKKVQTQNEVMTAYSIVQYYQDMEKSGKLSKDEAQKQAKAAITSLRYGEDNTDYFFVIDLRPYIIVHPMNAKLVDTDVSQYKDANGDFMFQKMVQIAKEQKEGFTSYMWQYKTDAKRIVAKTSYIKTFEPWNWVIGTGIYTVDVQEEVGGLRTSLTIISLIIMLISIGACIWLTRIMIAKPLNNLVTVGKAVAVGDVEQDIKVKSGDEVGEVTQAFADVVTYLKEMAAAATKISEGNLSIEIQAKSDKDALSKSFSGMASTLNSLMSEVAMLTKAGTEGKLQTRGDVSKFKGDYASIVQGVNDTLECRHPTSECGCRIR